MSVYEGLSDGEMKELFLSRHPEAIIDVMGIFDDFVTDSTWLDDSFDKDSSYFIIVGDCAKSFNCIHDIVKEAD